MAVNAIEVLYLTSGLFKAVPSKAVLTDLAKATNLDTLAKDLGNTPYAINAFPVTSNAEKAKVLAENLLGSSVTDKTAAVTALEGVLNANGGNVGVAALIAIKEILKGGTYADAKAQLENRVKVAEAYVNSPRGTEISTSILNEVTKDAATATAAIEKLNSNNTPGGDYAGTPNDDTVSLLGGLASTIKIEGGQQGAAGDTLVITAQASATANVINLQNFADQNQTLDAQQRKVSPIIQGFENVDATGSTTEMNITGRDRTSELNTGSVASTQTGSVLKGGAYRDTVTGAAGADSIEGNAGNDVLSGGAGNDTIKGGADNDSITGGTGNDTIEDGTGNDTVSGGADNDTITIGGGVDLINGDDGNDTISFAKDAAAGTSATVRTTVNGGAGNDTIDNTNATATSFLQVSGGANNDKITLGVATENINAGANNDIIVIKQAALDQVGTVAAGDLDVLNGNDGQDALQLLLTSGDATTTFRLTPVNGQYSGFEVIELIDESGNTNAKTYKIDLTDDFVANNFVNGQFLIDARGLPAGSNLVIDTSALTAASAARFATGAFQVWTSPSTDIRDQLNKTIDANYLINASNTALTATRAFYTNASDTTNKAGVHDATTGLITTAPTGATAYTVIGGTAETTTGGSTGGNTFTLTANSAVLLATGGSANVTPAGNLSSTADTINANINLNSAFIQDTTTGDGDVLNATLAATYTANQATILGIETLNLTGAGGSLNVAQTTGATAINLVNGVVGLTNVAATTPVTLNAGFAGTANLKSASAAAAADFAITLAGGSSTATVAFEDSAAAQLVAGSVVTANVTANTTLARLADDDSAAAAAAGAGDLVVKGSGNLTVADLQFKTVSISADGYTGALDLTVKTASAANHALAGSTGNDTFNLTNTFVAAGDTVNGGAGSDTLKINDVTAVTLTNVTNVENVVVSGSTATTVTTAAANLGLGETLNINGSALSGVKLTTAGGATAIYKLNITGSAQGDTLVAGAQADSVFGGEGADTITGGAGNDFIDLTEATSVIDTVVYASATDGVDTIKGFVSAKDLYDTDFVTTKNTVGAGTTVKADVAAAAGAVTLATTNDVVNITGTLQAAITDFSSGAQVLAAISGTSVSITATTNTILMTLSSGGNTYLYQVTEGADAGAVLDAADVVLVGTFQGTAALVAADII